MTPTIIFWTMIINTIISISFLIYFSSIVCKLKQELLHAKIELVNYVDSCQGCSKIDNNK